MNVDNKMEFRNILRSLKSIDFLVLFLFLWMLVSHYNNVNYTNWYGILSDISLRNNLLIFFYYSISRLFFHYYRITSFYICIAIMLFVAFRESYLSIWQLIEGADVPVGSMINPVIEGCMFSITCCVSFVAIQRIPKKKIRVILLFLLSPFIILILLTKSRLALIELIIPILCYFSLNNKYSVLVKKHAVLIIVSLVTLFSVLYVVKKPSADGRFYMAKIAVLSISHNGVFGSGTESYSGRFGEEQYKFFGGNEGEVDINTIVNNDLRGSMYACSPATAFNEFLRLGVEYGVIAMLLSVIIIIKSIIVLLKKNDALGYGLLSLFITSLFSYPHCFVIFCLFLSLFVGAASSLDLPLLEGKNAHALLIRNYVDVILIGLMLYSELPELRHKQELEKKEDNITFLFKYKEYQTVCDYCSELFDRSIANLDLLYEYGVSLSLIGQYEKSDSILHIGASNCSDPIFWQEIGHNNLRSENYEAAEKAYFRSFLMVPNRITPLLYLAQLYHHIGDKEKLTIIAEYSDHFIPKVPSNTTREYQKIIKELANEE